MSLRTIDRVSDMQTASDRFRSDGKRIAIVPTMGALHEGHLSLIRLARSTADVVICSIFVNPTQFGPHEDYTRYPRAFDADVALVERAGGDLVFHPDVAEMYPDGFQTYVVSETLGGVFEGSVRPGHFRGVATVVAKLIGATRPHAAVFGQKDAQQVAVVRALVRDLHLGVEIVVAPIAREDDGLARSSRNIYLSADERRRSVALSRSLAEAQQLVRSGMTDPAAVRARMETVLAEGRPDAVDYIAFVDPDTFRERPAIVPGSTLAVLAARFGATRLLDNALLTNDTGAS